MSTMEKQANIAMNEDGSAVLSVNPALFAQELISQAAYALNGKVYSIMDADKTGVIKVTLRAKAKDTDVLLAAREFNNLLVGMAVSRIQEEKNKEARESVIRQEQFSRQDTTSQEIGFKDDGFEAVEKGLMELEKESLEDPLGIAKPWGNTEEKAKEEKQSSPSQ